MNYNLHTHTYRCTHATGTEREYIDRALSCGVKVMGFSDHIPFRFPDGYESYYRIPLAQVEDYFETLKALREEYQDRIQIHIGFEMEYYPLYFQEMLENAKRFGAEYLILGQHFLNNEHPDGQSATAMDKDPAHLKEYVDCVVAGIKSGVFTYVAHPDIFNFAGEDSVYLSEMKRICDASLEYNIPLEINFLGIRSQRRYPRELFWELVGQTGAPVTFGFDAHDILAAYDEKSLRVAESWVQKYHLNYVGMAPIIPIK
ncbi:MAG: histidinol-phosphatase [Clostridia bacterium]|nr:histidinol-phosphatase [Clostridia bacterium]